MKKTLLSVVAGLAVIGSSFAVPSLDRQREDCEENPNFVWVEKTKTCVPINPCATDVAYDNPSIAMAYCADFILGNYGEQQELIYEKYIEQVLQTKISQKKSRLYDDKGWVDAYILQDGGYIAFQVWQDDDLSPLFATCAAYGHPTSGEACLGEYTEEQCNDVANFYTLLSNKVCHGHVGTYSCELGCD